jgi:solute carrier family 25 phosphate transporter 3
VTFFYSNVFNSRPKDQYSLSLQLLVTFTSGYLAGIICAIVSHPADTMMSKLNNHKTEGGVFKNMKLIYREVGF